MNRNPAIDGARGIAILAVAWFHMTRGLVSAGHLNETFTLKFADTFAYSFHVQMFFLVSGFFLYGKIGSAAHLIPRVANLYWPYLVWSGISGVLLLFVSGANSSISVAQLLLIPILPIQHFWFLLYLIGCCALLLAIPKRVELAAGVFLAANLTVLTLGVDWWGGDMAPRSLTYWPAFFLVGCALAKHKAWPPAKMPAFVLSIAVALVGALISFRSGMNVRSSIFVIPSLSASYTVYCIAVWFGGDVLSWLGRNSMAIFLPHVIFGSALRIAIFKLWPLVPVGIAALLIFTGSVLVSSVLFVVSKRMGLAPALGLSPIVGAYRFQRLAA